jgi:NhaP-type Na+/H+ or K+/H+ antiporter
MRAVFVKRITVFLAAGVVLTILGLGVWIGFIWPGLAFFAAAVIGLILEEDKGPPER